MTKKTKLNPSEQLAQGKLSGREFLEKNLILAPAMKRSINQKQDPVAMIKQFHWLEPLDILEVFANDPRVPTANRIDAAKAAAPYRHQKMAVKVEHSGTLSLAQIVAASSDPDNKRK